MKSEYVDLGYMNDWKETPPEVQQCREAKHIMFYETIGRCLYEYSCKECKIKYKVDSSD